jgi:hypothetical protein
MSQEKYIGMDVHQATISVAVLDAQGKLILRTRSSPSIEGFINELLKSFINCFRCRQVLRHL